MSRILVLTIALFVGFAPVVGVAKSKAKKTVNAAAKYSTELVDLINDYSKRYKVSFIVDPGVRGKIMNFIQRPSDQEKDLNVLAHALTINGYTLIEKGDYWVIRSSRNAQRDGIPVFKNQLPPRYPERMVSYVHQLNNKKASKVLSELRVLTSKDGEMSVDMDRNLIITSDYTTNIHRVAEILKSVDQN